MLLENRNIQNIDSSSKSSKSKISSKESQQQQFEDLQIEETKQQNFNTDYETSKKFKTMTEFADYYQAQNKNFLPQKITFDFSDLQNKPNFSYQLLNFASNLQDKAHQFKRITFIGNVSNSIENFAKQTKSSTINYSDLQIKYIFQYPDTLIIRNPRENTPLYFSQNYSSKYAFENELRKPIPGNIMAPDIQKFLNNLSQIITIKNIIFQVPSWMYPLDLISSLKNYKKMETIKFQMRNIAEALIDVQEKQYLILNKRREICSIDTIKQNLKLHIRQEDFQFFLDFHQMFQQYPVWKYPATLIFDYALITKQEFLVLKKLSNIKALFIKQVKNIENKKIINVDALHQIISTKKTLKYLTLRVLPVPHQQMHPLMARKYQNMLISLKKLIHSDIDLNFTFRDNERTQEIQKKIAYKKHMLYPMHEFKKSVKGWFRREIFQEMVQDYLQFQYQKEYYSIPKQLSIYNFFKSYEYENLFCGEQLQQQ